MPIKEIILSDEDNLIKILEHYDYCHIVDKGNEIRCCKEEDKNPTGISILKNENITVSDFVDNISGDIFTLLMEHHNQTFKEVITTIREVLNIKVEYKNQNQSEKEYLIDSVLSDLVFETEEELEIYPDDTLNEYEDRWNKRFFSDGINIETQKKFNIMYDSKTERIVIPHYTKDGDLCGIMGRTNIDNKDIVKYYPLIAFKKSLTLYGYSQNYRELKKSDTIYIGEAEKFVMQLDSMGYNNAVALCGNSISREQMIMIAKLEPEKVVFCFDEGLSEEAMFRSINKFVMFTSKLNIDTYLMIDRKNKYIKKDSKSSPSDYDKVVWENMIKECCEKM